MRPSMTPPSGARSLAAQRELASSYFFDWAVHASSQHRYLYVVNPKVGCSSILWTLQRLERGDDAVLPERVGTIHERDHSPLPRPSELGLSVDSLRDPSYFKFTFVRNPFDRLLSCYLQKLTRLSDQSRLVLKRLGRDETDPPGVDFPTFVSLVTGEDPLTMDPHWRVQSIQTLQGLADYDAIGRFEDFDHDLERIGTRLSPDFRRFLYAERRQATGEKPYHWFTPDLADAVRETYAEDFQRFGYPLDVPSTP